MTQITGLDQTAFGGALGNDRAADNIMKKFGVGGVTFTIGAEATEAITVNLQLEDFLGNDIAAVTAVEIFIFSDATGTTINTQDYTSIAAGTDGTLLEVVADKYYVGTSEADGDLDVVLTETGAGTVYLGVKLGDGTLAISSAITHA